MAQATHENTRLTRRAAMVAGLAAAAVPAVPALATASGDARLLELGRKFEPLFAKYLTFWPAYKAVWDRVEERKRAEVHPSPEEWSNLEPGTYESRVAGILEAIERINKEEGFDKLSDEHDALCESAGGIDQLTDEIVKTPATTLAGLAVKARAACMVFHSYWDGPRNKMDIDEHLVRELVDGICRLAGAPEMPEGEHAA
jgi:hypothetical protein